MEEIDKWVGRSRKEVNMKNGRSCKKYVPPNLNQDGLDTAVPVPVSQDG